MFDQLFVLSRRYLETKQKPYQRTLFQNTCFKHRLSVLVGQRGVGKTTLIVQYLLKQVNNDLLSQKILYVPADHFLLGEMSLYEIAEEFVRMGGEIIAFDEIHKYSDWSKELKSIYDTFHDLKIIASGSSMLEIHKGTHDLTRRAIVCTVKGLSFREYLELELGVSLPNYQLSEILDSHEVFAQKIIKLLKKENKKILPLFNQYLKFGYYPYYLEIKDQDAYLLTLEQNFHTIIESDMTAIYPALTGASIRKIKHLLAFIAESVPFTPNWKKIKEIVEIGDERTLKSYFKYLEDAGLIRMVMRYSKKIRKLENPEKIYLDNTNQLSAISVESYNIGTVRETFFLSMMAASNHKINLPLCGDFIIDGKIHVEIGGKNKGFEQIKNQALAYLACDAIEEGFNNKIPLWLFGFLY